MQILPNNAFRASAGIVLVNRQGLILALERMDIPGAWQLPQGGLLEDETPLDAARRELLEETGVDRRYISEEDEYPQWLAYELPEKMRTSKHGRGQVQKWFLFLFNGTDSDIDLNNATDGEFSSWRWMKLSDLINVSESFRRPIYESIDRHFYSKLAQ